MRVLELSTPAGAGGSSTCGRWGLLHLQILEPPEHAGVGVGLLIREIRLLIIDMSLCWTGDIGHGQSFVSTALTDLSFELVQHARFHSKSHLTRIAPFAC